jgi:hypothetical protein
MTLETRSFALEITSAGLFVRLPLLGEAFMDFTGQHLSTGFCHARR